MKGKLNIYYDEEGDFLEIGIDDPQEGTFQNLGDGIFERVNKNTGEIMGLAITSFKKRTSGLKELKFTLPLKLELTHSK
jgi:uncharacterized protein YuzE